jgi:prepilin-type N-terminal cleavage/methylation domain-containing protein
MLITGEHQYPEGFTLLEVLTVIAIMALIGGIMFPRVDRMLDSVRFASAQSMVAAAAHAARAQAIRTDSTVVLDVSPDGRDLLSNGQIVTELPQPVRVTTAGEAAHFYGDGSASAGALRLTGGRARAELQILSPSGTTQWRR